MKFGSPELEQSIYDYSQKSNRINMFSKAELTRDIESLRRQLISEGSKSLQGQYKILQEKLQQRYLTSTRTSPESVNWLKGGIDFNGQTMSVKMNMAQANMLSKQMGIATYQLKEMFANKNTIKAEELAKQMGVSTNELKKFVGNLNNAGKTSSSGGGGGMFGGVMGTMLRYNIAGRIIGSLLSIPTKLLNLGKESEPYIGKVSTIAGKSTYAYSALSDMLSMRYGTSFGENMMGFYQSLSGGSRGENSYYRTKKAVELARGGLGDVGETSKFLSSAYKVAGEPKNQKQFFDKISNAAAYAVQSQLFTMPSLTNAFKMASGSIAGQGQDTARSFLTLSFLSSMGFEGSKGGRHFSNILSRVPRLEKEFGIPLRTKEGGFMQVDQIIGELYKTMQNLTTTTGEIKDSSQEYKKLTRQMSVTEFKRIQEGFQVRTARPVSAVLSNYQKLRSFVEGFDPNKNYAEEMAMNRTRFSPMETGLNMIKASFGPESTTLTNLIGKGLQKIAVNFNNLTNSTVDFALKYNFDSKTKDWYNSLNNIEKKITQGLVRNMSGSEYKNIPGIIESYRKGDIKALQKYPDIFNVPKLDTIPENYISKMRGHGQNINQMMALYNPMFGFASANNFFNPNNKDFTPYVSAVQNFSSLGLEGVSASMKIYESLFKSTDKSSRYSQLESMILAGEPWQQKYAKTEMSRLDKENLGASEALKDMANAIKDALSDPEYKKEMQNRLEIQKKLTEQLYIQYLATKKYNEEQKNVKFQNFDTKEYHEEMKSNQQGR